MNNKHVVILGHGEGDPGATGVSKSERAYLQDIGKAIKNKANEMKLPIVVIDNINVFKRNDLRKNAHKYKKALSVTELHFNAFNKKAEGSEILFGAGFKEDALDVRIKNWLSTKWKWRRFIKSDNYQNPREAKKHGINYRLVEICFCDNPNDMSKYNAVEVASGLIQCIVNKDITPVSYDYIIQLGRFSMYQNAEKKLKEVQKHYPDAWIRQLR